MKLIAGHRWCSTSTGDRFPAVPCAQNPPSLQTIPMKPQKAAEEDQLVLLNTVERKLGACIKKSSNRTTGFASRRLAVVRSCRKTNSSQYAARKQRHFKYFSEHVVTMLNMLSLLSTTLHVPHPWTSRQAFAVRIEDMADKKWDKSNLYKSHTIPYFLRDPERAASKSAEPTGHVWNFGVPIHI